jgi:FkbM family methyltransferase
MFLKKNSLRYKASLKFRNIALRLFNYFENNNNCNFYKNGEAEFLKKLCKYWKEGRKEKVVIFDIGAHVGSYAEIIRENLFVNKMQYEMHLFEPTRESFKMLQSKFSEDDCMILNNFGFSSEEKECIIYYDKEKSGLASLYKRDLKTYGISFRFSEKIVLLRGDRYIKQRKLKHIDFIKIDVEGHELEVLKGFGEFLNADFIDFIQFEYGGAFLDAGITLKNIYDVLESKGFRIGKIMKDGIDLRKWQPFMENFFYSNYVAISRKILNDLEKC